MTCYRYLELNPVRAGMVNHPSEYPWSSYHFNALGGVDELVVPHELYRRLGSEAAERQKAYRQLFRHHIGERTLNEIREATNKAWVLGNDRFREQIERKLNRRATPTPRGGDRRSAKYRAENRNHRR